MHKQLKNIPTALDFFSGSGLVTTGLEPSFRVIWANDNDTRKNAIYHANYNSSYLNAKSIEDVHGDDIPNADLAWASFPCQDLSLAGNMSGISAKTRSGLFWQWTRILREMGPSRRPQILAVENVVGFLIANEGKDFYSAYTALKKLGYRAGAITINASLFVPQSRPRAFLVAVKEGTPYTRLALASAEPLNPLFHSGSVMRAYQTVNDKEWIWWKIPTPSERHGSLRNICERNAEFDPPKKTTWLLSMLSPKNRQKLEAALRSNGIVVGAGYKRMRIVNGRKVQRLELRFDGLAGCLRTPNGGSSRQILLFTNKGKVFTRLLTIRESARLMGVKDTYQLPGSYNEAYKAMGDAVAVPVTQWLARYLLLPLATRKALDYQMEKEPELTHA